MMGEKNIVSNTAILKWPSVSIHVVLGLLPCKTIATKSKQKISYLHLIKVPRMIDWGAHCFKCAKDCQLAHVACYKVNNLTLIKKSREILGNGKCNLHMVLVQGRINWSVYHFLCVIHPIHWIYLFGEAKTVSHGMMWLLMHTQPGQTNRSIAPSVSFFFFFGGGGVGGHIGTL